MTKQQLIDYTIKKLTGGGLVSFDVSPDLCDEVLSDVLDIVSAWYVEDIIVQTVEVTFASDIAEGSAITPRNGYINTNSLSYPVHYIDTIVPLRRNYKGDYILDEISDLLGLPAGLFTANATIEYAVWIQTRAMIRKAMSLKMQWKHIPSEQKIYIHKVPSESGTQVSVFYFPLPEKLNDVSFGPAIQWIKKRLEAEYKLIWSTVLLKASPDPATIGFANTIRTEANNAIEKSDASLSDLQFIYTSFQRN
jgi:hypothetical protein